MKEIPVEVSGAERGEPNVIPTISEDGRHLDKGGRSRSDPRLKKYKKTKIGTPQSARIQMARERMALIDRPKYKKPGEWYPADISTFEKHLKKYEKVKGQRRIPPERVSFDIVDDAVFSQRSPRKKSQFHKRMIRLDKSRKNIPKDQNILNKKREVFPEHSDLTPNFQKKHEVGSDELGFTNKEAERLTGNRSNYHGSFSKLRQRLGAVGLNEWESLAKKYATPITHKQHRTISWLSPDGTLYDAEEFGGSEHRDWIKSVLEQHGDKDMLKYYKRPLEDLPDPSMGRRDG